METKKGDKRVAMGLLIIITVLTIAGIITLVVVKRNKRPSLPVNRVQTMISTYSVEDGTAKSIKSTESGMEIEREDGEYITIPDNEIITATDEKGKEFTYRDIEEMKTAQTPVLVTKHHMVFELGTNASSIQQIETGYLVILNDGSQADVPFEEVEYVKAA